MAAAFKFTVIAAVLGALMRRQTERATTAKGDWRLLLLLLRAAREKETWPTSAASVVPIHFLHVVY